MIRHYMKLRRIIFRSTKALRFEFQKSGWFKCHLLLKKVSTWLIKPTMIRNKMMINQTSIEIHWMKFLILIGQINRLNKRIGVGLYKRGWISINEYQSSAAGVFLTFKIIKNNNKLKLLDNFEIVIKLIILVKYSEPKKYVS
jgi:hypothetical protein